MELQAVVSGRERAENWTEPPVRAIGVLTTELSLQSPVSTIKTYILPNSIWPSTHSKLDKFFPYSKNQKQKNVHSVN